VSPIFNQTKVLASAKKISGGEANVRPDFGRVLAITNTMEKGFFMLSAKRALG